MTVSNRTCFVGLHDSRPTIFFKEFFSNEKTRYVAYQHQNTTVNYYEYAKEKESPKEKPWQTNCLKILLCFTVIYPLTAGIFKLIQMRNLNGCYFAKLDPPTRAEYLTAKLNDLEKNLAQMQTTAAEAHLLINETLKAAS